MTTGISSLIFTTDINQILHLGGKVLLYSNEVSSAIVLKKLHLAKIEYICEAGPFRLDI